MYSLSGLSRSRNSLLHIHNVAHYRFETKCLSCIGTIYHVCWDFDLYKPVCINKVMKTETQRIAHPEKIQRKFRNIECIVTGQIQNSGPFGNDLENQMLFEMYSNPGRVKICKTHSMRLQNIQRHCYKL